MSTSRCTRRIGRKRTFALDRGRGELVEVVGVDQRGVVNRDWDEVSIRAGSDSKHTIPSPSISEVGSAVATRAKLKIVKSAFVNNIVDESKGE